MNILDYYDIYIYIQNNIKTFTNIIPFCFRLM